MSTVRLVATTFRWIIEILNVLFAIFLVFSVFVYLFNREQISLYAALFGFGNELAVVATFLLIAVFYVLIMGLLCVVLEIWESLKRIESGKGELPRIFTQAGSEKTNREPRI